jgi:hypothetical protein
MKKGTPEKERRKVVWQDKRDKADDHAPGALCPDCQSRGSLLHRSPTASYFICPSCERTWQEERS